MRKFGSVPTFTSPISNKDSRLVSGTQRDPSSYMATRIMQVIVSAGHACGYTPSELKAMHVYPHSLHGSFAAYSEAMEWDVPRQFALGRWKLPPTLSGQAPLKRTRGGSFKPKTIVATYSTAAACQKQLEIRTEMIAALSERRCDSKVGSALDALF